MGKGDGSDKAQSGVTLLPVVKSSSPFLSVMVGGVELLQDVENVFLGRDVKEDSKIFSL